MFGYGSKEIFISRDVEFYKYIFPYFSPYDTKLDNAHTYAMPPELLFDDNGIDYLGENGPQSLREGVSQPSLIKPAHDARA